MRRAEGLALPAATIEKKSVEVENVAKAYELEKTFHLDFPTVRLDTVSQSDLIESIRGVADEVKPETVCVVHDGDVHTDHHAVFTAVFSVFKAFNMLQFSTRRMFCYETLFSTDAAPQLPGGLLVPKVYRDITPFMDRKAQIMGLYESEAQSDPMPRGPSAVRAFARFWGPRSASITPSHSCLCGNSTDESRLLW